MSSGWRSAALVAVRAADCGGGALAAVWSWGSGSAAFFALAVLLVACGTPSVEAVNAGSGCVGCHPDAPAGKHALVPCVSCHLGNASGTVAETAHAGLAREPGALDTVDRTCGACHPEEVSRVRTSPMATGRGILGVDRFAFGEAPTPDTEATLADVLASPSPSPADDHARRLCAGCHLGTRKANRDDAVTGGSGCAACHAGASPPGHSTVDSKIPDSRCAGCHSRSARVSLTYAGRVEAPAGDALPDGRHTVATTPDVHAAAGLACIDCHVHTELMGDGVSRAHEEQQVELRCVSCHGAAPAEVKRDDPVTARLPAGDGSAVGARGTPLWNVAAGVLTGKLDGKTHPIPKVTADHAGRGHERLSCQACHSAVAPTCGSCHTAYDPTGTQWDFGAGAEKPGRWVETGAAEALLPPALGVDAAGTIRPAIPGMVATLQGREVRRYALTDPHATRRASRTCADCHRSPVALGLGSGALDPETFRFTPAHPVSGFIDLADDGWTTLGAAVPGEGNRVGARSLNLEEQRKVLRVGVCLRCHEGAAVSTFADLFRRPERCRAPPGWWDQAP